MGIMIMALIRWHRIFNCLEKRAVFGAFFYAQLAA